MKEEKLNRKQEKEKYESREKKIEEKGTLTLSLYQRRKKVKTTPLPRSKPPPSLYHLDSAQSSSTPTRRFDLGYLLTLSWQNAIFSPFFSITASFLNWHLLFLTSQHSSTNDNSVPCRTDAGALSISGNNS